MITEDQMTRLRSNEDFKAWLDHVYDIREATIGGMIDCATDMLHQRTGAMAAYQSLLDMAKYDRRTRPM